MALMSKPMAVTLPLILIILDIYPLERLSIKKAFSECRAVLIEKIPFFILSIASSVVTIIAQQASGAIKHSESVWLIPRILTAFNSLIFYLYKMIWPAGLAPLYPYPPEVSLIKPQYSAALALTLLITAGCFMTRKNQKPFSAAWAYYVVTLLPVLGIIQVGVQAAADRYTYLPSLGPFVLIGLGVGAIYRNRERYALLRKYLFIPIILVICTLSFMTVKQTVIWKDSITLWSRELQLYDTHIAYNSRGGEYLKQGKYQKALIDINRAIELFPSYAKAYYNRGTVYLNLMEYPAALQDLNRAIKLDPAYMMALSNRGIVYYRLKNYNTAVADFSTAIGLDSRYAPAFNNRGSAYMELNKYNDAIADFNKAIELDRKYASAYYNRGKTYYILEKYRKALTDLDMVIGLDPRNMLAYRNRALCYEKLGERDRAVTDFQQAARLGDDKVRDYLGSMGIKY